MLKVIRCVFFHGMLCLSAIFLLAGCYRIYSGRYIAENVPGWSRSEYAGAYFFYYPTKGTPNWYIEVGGDKGKVHLRIGSHAYDPNALWEHIKFSGSPIKIVFHDQIKERIVPSKDFRSPPGQELPVDDSQDFTVIIPSFQINENVIPELLVHFRWSNEKYRVWVPIQ